MADTSQRATRIPADSGNTLIEKNKEGASIAQGNEVAGNVYNFIRAQGITFDNTENFNQSQSNYYATASAVYTESEKFVQAAELAKAMLSYTATFNANEYTLSARVATIGELIPNGVKQDSQDKTVYLSPLAITDGFHTQFIAPATNTGSVTFKIQLYDGSFTTIPVKKYNNGILGNLSADDIRQNSLYNVVIIGGEAVLFAIDISIATEAVRGISYVTKPIKLTYDSVTSFLYSDGTFNPDDGSATQKIDAGTIDLTSTGAGGLDTGALASNTTYHIFAIYNPTTNTSSTITSLSLSSPTFPSGFTKKRHIFSFITNASSRLRPMIIDIDGTATYQTPIADLSASTFTANGATVQQALTIPAGVRCEVSLHAYLNEQKSFWFGDGTSTFTMTDKTQGNFGLSTNSSPDELVGQVRTRTNTSREIRISSWNTSGAASIQLTVQTQSYKIIL